MTIYTNQSVKVIFLAVLLILLFAGPVFAHRITIIGWVEGDTVFTEGCFSGGTKPKNALIQVFDPDKNLLLEGKTDENGEFSFKVPSVVTLTVLINAGAGHQATCEISEEDIRAEAVLISSETGNEDLADEGAYISEDMLRKIVSSEVNKQLKSFLNQINAATAHTEPSVTDILGGIGYIIGLVGLGTFFHYRSKSREKH
jgi:nickel transport protein